MKYMDQAKSDNHHYIKSDNIESLSLFKAEIDRNLLNEIVGQVKRFIIVKGRMVIEIMFNLTKNRS